MMQVKGYLSGYLLVAPPHTSSIVDREELNERAIVFERSVVFVCRHDETGAMGFVINQALEGLELLDLLQNIENTPLKPPENILDNPAIYWGGPVEMNRGFVLHSLDYQEEATLGVNGYGVTANMDILRDIFKGQGPKHYLLVLGYAGWEADQLEKEIESHAWLPVEASQELLFDIPVDDRWEKALEALGVRDPFFLSRQGNA